MFRNTLRLLLCESQTPVELTLRAPSSRPGVETDEAIFKRTGVSILLYEVYPIQQSVGRKGVVQFTLIREIVA